MGLFSSKPSAQRSVSLTKDPTGAPAVNLTKVREHNPDLAKSADKVGFALSTKGLAGVRAKVMVLLDHSGSMLREYENGAVATLFQRTMGLALQIDDDGEIPVIPFDDRIRPTFNLNAANFTTAVDAVWDRRDMGSTNLAGALEVVLDAAKKTDEPIFLVVLTDGNPDRQAPATKVVCQLAGYPVFIKFMALKPVSYLSELDDLEETNPGARLIDNVDAKPEKNSDLNLLSCTDAEFAAALVDEWDTWIAAATAAHLIK